MDYLITKKLCFSLFLIHIFCSKLNTRKKNYSYILMGGLFGQEIYQMQVRVRVLIFRIFVKYFACHAYKYRDLPVTLQLEQFYINLAKNILFCFEIHRSLFLP